MSQLGGLRVVHIAEDMGRIAGGVPAVVNQLSERLMRNGVAVQLVYATGVPSEVHAGVDVFTFPPNGIGRLWSWGGGLQEGVARLAMPSDGDMPVFHVHGAWSAPQYFAARAAFKAGVSYVFTAHGMLEPWLWDRQGWTIRAKKRMYWSALAYPALSKATVIHAITPLEKKNLARLFPTNRIEVIPNAVDLSHSGEPAHNERTKTILFLGRIEPKKGVDVLLRAFAKARIDKEWSIDVVGPVWSQPYLSSLKAIVQECGLEQRVRFRGPLFGDEKRKLIDAAWVLAAPSHSEVVGLVNLEAAARCLPTITTHQTGLDDWESGGGLLIEPTDVALGQALETACSWNVPEQHDRGLASRLLVEHRYSWQAVMPMWLRLYSSL